MEQFDNLDEYIADLKAKLEVNPTCGNTHYNLGVAYLSRRDFVEAEREFLDAVAHSPRMAEGYVQLGGIALQREDMESCLNLQHPGPPSSAPSLPCPGATSASSTCSRASTTRRTRRSRRPSSWTRNSPKAQATMSTLLITMDDYEEADKILKKLLEKQPNFGPAWNNKAIIDAHNGEWADAASCIQRAEESGFEVLEALKKEVEENNK